MKKLLIICGPTATGKTELALALAAKYCGELVSADSRQVYKGMDIGTGKDIPYGTKPENSGITVGYKDHKYALVIYKRDKIPIWLYDVVEPGESFSVSHFHHIATRVIDSIGERGKLPIVVGGTGFYIRSLTDIIDTIHIPPDRGLRKRWEHATVSELQRELVSRAKEIFDTMNQSDRANPRRLIRKLEVADFLLKHGKVDGQSYKETDTLIVGLTASETFLRERIEARVERRFQDGITGEIEALLTTHPDLWSFPAASSLGYREWRSYFETAVLRTEASTKKVLGAWIRDECEYAKRQQVWFKKNKSVHWFSVEEKNFRSHIAGLVDAWYTNSGHDFKN